MNALLDFVRDHPTLTSWAVGASIATFVLSALLLPIAVGALPAEYFVGDHPPRPAWTQRYLRTWRLVQVLKNVAGAVLLLIGLAMLVLPGQGILTLLAALVLLDLPKKRALEQKIVRRPTIHRALNWIRARRGREPFVLPPDGE
ncbi:PGPGW domain-containing protein [Rohdeia mirabilis]|uniref:PGPGW domain-containing protein n=1 Tax=Rohdeia mirabilis TaxID=2528008 RepID=UPI003AF35F5C